MSSSFKLDISDEKRILMVDANHQSRSLRARSLSLLGYKIDEAVSDQQARAKLGLERYDLMLLNLEATDEDGHELMLIAREIQPGLLLIVLTGRPALVSAIKAIKAGAVDYLLEPADIQDIIRSVAQALQKQATEREWMLSYISEIMDELNKPKSIPVPPPVSRISAESAFKIAGNLKLDLKSLQLTIMSDPTYTVQLTEGGAAVLASLMSHPNQVLSCQQIAKITWGYDVPEEEAVGIVQSTIYRLRRRIGSNPRSPKIIRTIRGRGYMFASD